jgi:hypothetical protein
LELEAEYQRVKAERDGFEKQLEFERNNQVLSHASVANYLPYLMQSEQFVSHF